MNAAFRGTAGLFERLGQAPAATIVTPNLRLAHDLARRFDRHQLGRGLDLWDAPDILPFSAFVARAYEDALYSPCGAGLPLVLAPAEEAAVWEAILRAAEDGGALLALPEAAAAAREAWKTAHAWRLLEEARRVPRNEDAEAFLGWAQRYERVTRQAGHTDAARLPDVVASLVVAAGAGEPGVPLPALLVRYGFDIVTPQQQALFDALAARGCEVATGAPEPCESRAVRVACLDARDEIRHAARWARQRLEARPGEDPPRIGIVVPDLVARRNAIARTFAQVLGTWPAGAGVEPLDHGVQPFNHGVQPFNISLGAPLDDYPLVDAAFGVLELTGRGVEFARASQLIRSPFIGGAETELARRAQLDAMLRRRAEPELTLDRLIGLVQTHPAQPQAPLLARHLKALGELRKARLFGAQSPVAWARAFSDALLAAGFPGERTLDSAEYQVLGKWHDVLAQFARLERVAPRMGHGEAVARLRRLAADTAFQPETPQVPVQVLGVLESAGCQFDHLWVMGLSADAWPFAARPNPFLPLALQRKAGLPESSAQASLELDRRITAGWLGAAAEVVLSHPSREADRELAPSPLIGEVPAASVEALALPDYPTFRDVIHASSVLERLEDARAPAVAALERRGGSALLRDQAACPFRAFARHRLASEALGEPHAGLDALERGALVHQVLAAAWNALETKHALDSIGGEALERVLEAAAEVAVARQRRERPTTLAGRFAEVEKRRLVRLARAWLDYERGRGDFSVFATESERVIEVGGLRLKGRLDRVDETAAGERIVIDYKVHAPAPGAWVGERPDEPQLPLYLTAAEPAARAIAFAQVRAGEMKLVALAADKGILPEARTLPDKRLKRAAQSWGEQLEAWRAELDRLARGFAAGEATVDPRPGACQYCDQQPLCRISAREEGAPEPQADA